MRSAPFTHWSLSETLAQDKKERIVFLGVRNRTKEAKTGVVRPKADKKKRPDFGLAEESCHSFPGDLIKHSRRIPFDYAKDEKAKKLMDETRRRK